MRRRWPAAPPGRPSPAKPASPRRKKAPTSSSRKSIERWNFLIAHQADKAYDYLSPGYRATKSREVYAKEMNGRGLRWTKVTYGDQQCDADTCKVNLTVDYKLKMPGASGTVSSFGPLTRDLDQGRRPLVLSAGRDEVRKAAGTR